MSNRMWFEEEDSFEQVEQCESCPHPNGCIRECVIENHVFEDVARIRGETPEQLWGHTE